MRLLTIITTLTFCLLLSIPLRAQTTETRSLEGFLRQALQNNPTIQAEIASIEAAEGNALQQSLRPNPNALFEAENFAGERDLSGFDGAEFTLGVEQKLETGGKRRFRSNVANHELSMIQEQATAKILGTLSEVQFALIRHAVAQERLQLSIKRLGLANKTHDAVKKRVSAAAASDIEHTKIDIEQKAAEIKKRQAEKESQTAKLLLAKLLAIEPLSVDINNLSLEQIPEAPHQSALLLAITQSPQAKLLELNRRRAESAVNLARSQAVPDVTVGLGIRHFNDRDDNALMATLSVPIPIFDRNQGGVSQAKAEANKANAVARAGSLNLEETALRTWETYNTALQEVSTYQKDIIPSARRAYSQASEGYAAGRYSFLELLDAQRTLYQVQDAWLSSLLDLHEAKAQTDFLLNQHETLVTEFINASQGGTQ